ncbi:clathrin associated protein complex large subunit [Kluyveromyces marxianus]|nr:clathrin associated protein complex large subunit [Kluyveromyces marxianus]
MGSLRTFIKDVRSAKTLAEERSIITKESAKIRTKLKDDHISLERRRKYIHKLLYLYILGEKTHFAQVECINLIASEEFVDKRMGYLAAILLLDENQELLTLLTNLLNNDLNHSSRYVVSLAMNALGALASPELARDLYSDIKNILDHSRDSFLLKKALVCAAKLISKDASLLEIFAPYPAKMLRSKDSISHGVLIGTNKLIQAILIHSAQYEFDNLNDIIQSLSNLIPDLLAKLGSLTLGGGSANSHYSAGGCLDPFLQVELMTTLRLFLQNFPQQTEPAKNKLLDALTQVATYTPTSSNSNIAVLYEAVRTIFSFKAEHALRVLGVNVLGNLVASKDCNIKYVSLNALLDVVSVEPQAVQRHRKFISKCIFDPDVSIKKRALEMTFALLNPTNMKELVAEILAFLEKSGENDKPLILYCVDQLILVFDMLDASEDKWKLDVIVKVLKYVGQFIPVEKITDALIMINNTSDLDHKKNVVADIVNVALENDSSGQPDENLAWRMVSIWCIGEYGDLILGIGKSSEESLTNYLYESDSLHRDNTTVIHYVLMAALKLSIKIQTPILIERLRQLIKSHTQNVNLMIQIKAVQYDIIFNQPTAVKAALLEPMPIFHKKLPDASAVKSFTSRAPQTTAKKPAKKEDDLLIDLLGDLSTPDSSSNPQQPAKTSNDLLSGLSDLSSQVPQNNGNNVHSTPILTKTIINVPNDAISIHSSEFVEVFSKFGSVSSGLAELSLFLRAKKNINSLQILVAVPKSQVAEFGPLSSHKLASNEVAKQSLKILGGGKVKLRVKLNIDSNEDQFDHKYDVTI